MAKKLSIAELAKLLKGKEWRKRGKWHHSVISNEIYGEGESTKYAKKLGYKFKKDLGVWLSDGDFLDLKSEWDALSEVVNDGYRKDRKYLLKYAKDCLKLGDDLIAFSRKAGDCNPAKLTSDQLAKKYISVILKIKEYAPFMFSLHLFDQFLTERFDALLKAYIKKKGLGQKEFFEYQTALALPSRKIFVLEEKNAFDKILNEVKSRKLSLDGTTVKNIIVKHAGKYGWLNMGLLEEGPYSEGYYLKRLKSGLKSYNNLEFILAQKEEKRLASQQKRILKEIAKDKDFSAIVDALRIFGFLRSFRIDAIYIAFFNIWNITSEISKRLEIKDMDFKHLSSGEIAMALEGKNDYKKLISERKAGFISITVGDERYELTGKDEKYLEGFIDRPNANVESNAKEIKGSIAYPGKITARCKVLHSLKDMKKVKRGDIIVVSMTDPNYLPAMEKASSFVTDQGGILCHAAIVSREMKKPCIIGTKIATKVLKDGMKVEIDANIGIVKIIKKR